MSDIKRYKTVNDTIFEYHVADIVKQMQDRQMEGMINGKGTAIRSGHASSNDAAVANAVSHAIAHRATEEVAKEGFKTIRHQISIGQISDNDGWDTFFKAVMIIGGISLLGYLIYQAAKIIREQPDAVVKIANAVQGKGTIT